MPWFSEWLSSCRQVLSGTIIFWKTKSLTYKVPQLASGFFNLFISKPCSVKRGEKNVSSYECQKNVNGMTSVFCWSWTMWNLSNKHNRVGKWVTEFLKQQSDYVISTQSKCASVLFSGSQTLSQPTISSSWLSHTPLWVWPTLTVRHCHICNFKEMNAVTKAAHHSSTLSKSNLTSEEKHVNEPSSALFYYAV